MWCVLGISFPVGRVGDFHQVRKTQSLIRQLAEQNPNRTQNTTSTYFLKFENCALFGFCVLCFENVYNGLKR